MRTLARRSSTRAPERPAAARTRPQFGSPPWIAVRTRFEFVMVRAARRASAAEAAPRTRTSNTFVAPSPSATIIRARSAHTVWTPSSNSREVRALRRHAGVAVREHEQRVVRAGVAVDRDRVERRVRDVRDDPPQIALVHRRIRRHEREERRHVRMDHPRALRDAADAHRARGEMHLALGDLWVACPSS